MAPGPEGLGYNIFQLTVDGAVAHPIQSLWPEEQPMEGLHLAVSSDVLAMVDLAQDKDSNRPFCRLALARLGELTAVHPPTRFSDPPDPDTVLNDALACDITALDDSFLVVWHQFISSTSDASTFFAQAFDREGNELGARLTLTTSDELAGEFSVTSDGTRAVVVLQTARNGQSELAFIEGGELRSAAVDTRVGGFVTLAPAHDGFIAKNGGTFSVLDPAGRLVHGPIDLDTSTQLAPLDEGYVVVSNEEYLIARTLRADLGAPSAPTAISDNRLARGLQLVSAPDGSDTVLLYVDERQLHLARLVCSDTMPPPPGPPACPEQSAVTPLNDGCSDPVLPHASTRPRLLSEGSSVGVPNGIRNVTDRPGGRRG